VCESGGFALVDTEIELVRMRRFAMAADYMRMNGFTTPAFSFAIAAILWQWYPAWQVFGWAAFASIAQLTLGVTAHWSLSAAKTYAQTMRWRRRLMACSILAGVGFGIAVMAFYMPGERLNNILLIAMGVGSLATLAAMTSPDRGVMIASTAPFVLFLCTVMIVHEAYPYNLILSAMAILYCVETFVTANKLSAMVGRMIELQIGNGKLIASLAAEKTESDQARIRAERASRAKSNFLANMSHELRTPLNAILGFSEIIRDRTFGEAATARYTSYAADINKSGNHLLSLINDILDLSRIEAGKRELSDETLDLQSLLGDVVKLNAQQAAAHAVTLHVQCPAELLLVADRKAVLQALINLASNAIKFTPAGGGVTLRALRDGDAIALEVEDTGVGIAKDDLQRVLERFGQARHDIAATAEKGVGLGLPIVKGLMEAHGGQMTLDSHLGKGTRVRLQFPAWRSSAADKQAA
jgi:two-component system cell cycle sensor histidine kinase PleC